jgi:hypothetical protein
MHPLDATVQIQDRTQGTRHSHPDTTRRHSHLKAEQLQVIQFALIVMHGNVKVRL